MASPFRSLAFVPPSSFTPRRLRSRPPLPDRTHRCISLARAPSAVMQQQPTKPPAPPTPRPTVAGARTKLKRPERYSSSEWARSLFSLPHSRILQRVLPRVLPNMLVATAVSFAFPQLSVSIPGIGHVSALPHTFLATAMSLLLVFRTNAAYDRYWEGRKVWGRLINVSRAMARTANEAMPRRDARVAGALIVSYAHALQHHLQGRREREPFERLCKDVPVPSAWPRPGASNPGAVAPVMVSGLVEGAVASAFAAANEKVPRRKGWDPSAHSAMAAPPRLPAVINDAANKPLEVIVQLGKAVQLSMEHKEAVLTARGDGNTMNVCIERQFLEQAMTDFLDILGACERIVKSPVPLSWSRHTSRLLSIWSLTLPLVLVSIEGYLCVPTVAVISWGIFSIEEIAHILEDPFLEQDYSLPLGDMCQTIETDVLGQLIKTKG